MGNNALARPAWLLTCSRTGSQVQQTNTSTLNRIAARIHLYRDTSAAPIACVPDRAYLYRNLYRSLVTRILTRLTCTCMTTEEFKHQLVWQHVSLPPRTPNYETHKTTMARTVQGRLFSGSLYGTEDVQYTLTQAESWRNAAHQVGEHDALEGDGTGERLLTCSALSLSYGLHRAYDVIWVHTRTLKVVKKGRFQIRVALTASGMMPRTRRGLRWFSRAHKVQRPTGCDAAEQAEEGTGQLDVGFRRVKRVPAIFNSQRPERL